MIKILKNYDKISDKDLKEGNKIQKNKIIRNDNKNNINDNKNNNDKRYNKKKIFIFLLPMMFIINYFANNFKYNDFI